MSRQIALRDSGADVFSTFGQFSGDGQGWLVEVQNVENAVTGGQKACRWKILPLCECD